MFLVPVNSQDHVRFVGAEDYLIMWFSWDGSSSDIMMGKSLMINQNPNAIVQCGKADGYGRLYVGSSSSSDHGMLFMVELSGKITPMLDGLVVPIDMAWSSDDIRMYILDANLNQIVCYQYNKDTGALGDTCRETFDFNAQNDQNITCTANRMTIDTAGNLWVSCLGSAYVLQIDVVMSQIMIKVDLPDGYSATSIVFGGDTMEDLYVTTKINENQPEQYSKAGTLFEVTNTGYKGYACAKVDD